MVNRTNSMSPREPSPGPPDQSDVEEFQSLLADYRAASKQLLESEKEKREMIMNTNQQKELIEAQNAKIQELQRQFAIFEDTLKATNSANAKSQEAVLEKLEESLSSNLNLETIKVTKQITERVNENMDRLVAQNQDSQ